jgi:Domain of unknown function (DUF5615)
MSQIRLYLDEDAMRKSLVFALRARSVDVLTAAEVEMINRSDQDHLATATASKRVLFTFNIADYCALHQIWMDGRRSHAGIIVAPQQRYTAGEELRRLMHILGSVSAEDMQDRLEFLSAWE